MEVITLCMQVEWLETCLEAMKAKGRPQSEITLQECCINTLKVRMREAGYAMPEMQ